MDSPRASCACCWWVERRRMAMKRASARVAVIEDHPLFRAGLRTIFACDPDLLVTIETGSPREALDRARREPVDVAVVDLLLPEMSGFELIEAFRRLQPACH